MATLSTIEFDGRRAVRNGDRRSEFRLGAFGVRGYACEIERIDVGMIIGLTGTRRVGAGCFVALIYLLCVLAPTLSFALPGSRAVTPCLTEAAHGPGTVHMHTDAPIQHVRIDGHVHDHANVH